MKVSANGLSIEVDDQGPANGPADQPPVASQGEA